MKCHMLFDKKVCSIDAQSKNNLIDAHFFSIFLSSAKLLCHFILGEKIIFCEQKKLKWSLGPKLSFSKAFGRFKCCATSFLKSDANWDKLTFFTRNVSIPKTWKHSRICGRMARRGT